MRIKSILFYKLARTQRSYTTKQVPLFDARRLVAGMPAFIRTEPRDDLGKKILFLPGYDVSKWDEIKTHCVSLKLKQLQKMGFTIYRYNKEKLKNVTFFSQCDLEKSSDFIPDEAAISQLLGISGEELCVLTEELLDYILEGDEFDWETFIPFNSVSLVDNPITSQNFMQFLLLHGHKIETLQIANAPKIKSLTANEVNQLKQLIHLDLHCSVHVETQLAALKTRLPFLKSLNLESAKGSIEILEDILMPELHTLYLSDHNFKKYFLQKLLPQIPAIRILTLRRSINLDLQSSSVFNLNQLEHLDLSGSVITLASLQVFLQNAVNLRSLNLGHSTVIGNESVENLNISKLENLNLEESNIANKLFLAILQSVRQLKQLCLANCTNLQNIDLTPFDFSVLESLEINNYTPFNQHSLQHVFNQARNLKVLNLEDTELKLDTINFVGLDFNQLEVLTLNVKRIKGQILYDLLKNAPNLKKLKLNGDIDSEIFEDIQLEKLHTLEITSSNFSKKSLLTLLKKAPNLEKIWIVQSTKISHPLDFEELELSKLRNLYIVNRVISSTSLHQLTKASNQLERLEVTVEDGENSEAELMFNFNKLLSLNLQKSKLKAASLQQQLINAAQLQELDLSQIVINNSEGILKSLSFPNLKKINLKNATIDSKSLQALLDNTPQLKKLNLINCIITPTHNFNEVNLNNLKKIDLYGCTISSDALQCLLKQASKLKDLCLDANENLNVPGGIQVLNLTKLEFLRVHGAQICPSIMQAVIQGAPNCREIQLYKTTSEHLEPLIQTNFFHLRNLTINLSGITGEQLQKILNNAPNLRSLNLTKCSHLHDIDLTSISFNLQNLNLSDAFLPNKQLYALLKSASALQSLYLLNCDCTLDADDLNNLDFSKLTVLNLFKCRMDAATLEAILRKAPNLKEIYICDCPNLNTKEISEVFLSRLEKVELIDSPLMKASEKAILAHAPQSVKLQISKLNPSMDYSNPAVSLQQETSIDADTSLNKSKQMIVEHKFIGKPHSPALKNYRLSSYDQLELNKLATDNSNPFLLKKTSRSLQLEDLPKAERKFVDLYPDYQQSSDNHYFGRFEVHLSNEWQPLPSVSSNEILEAYKLDKNLDVEIKKSNKDQFHYIRLNPKSLVKPQKVLMEILLSCTKDSARYFNELPQEVKNVVNNCRGYREETLKMDKSNPTAQNYLDNIIEQRTGACRHRAVACMHMLKQQFPHIPVQIITNDAHSFVEIYHNGLWVRCDLGGYDVKIIEKHSLLPEGRDNKKTADLEAAEDIYQLTFSKRGRQLPSGYIEKAQNLVTLKLEHGAGLPREGRFAALRTLEITSCSLLANELNAFFSRTSTLNTLQINRCDMTPEEFIKIYLSGLSHLEHVTFKGNFIPNLQALKQVMATCKNDIKWVIESDNVQEELEEVPKISEDTAKNPRESVPNLQIQIKKTAKKLPARRYFTKEMASTLFSLIQSQEEKSSLVYCDNSESLRIAIEKQCQKAGKPCFYINSPEELQCANNYIEKEGFIGRIKKGPGGPLYDFIGEHSEAILLINYNNFTAADIARFNSILDDIRSVDGVPLPAQYKVLGLINTNNPAAYQGADFYSRFGKIEEFNEVIPAPTPFKLDKEILEPSSTDAVIELNGNDDWQSKVLGSWYLKGQELRFKEGLFIKALNAGKSAITFNNPPYKNPEFERFLNDMSIHQGLFHEGKLVKELPENFSLRFTQQISFPDKDTILSFPRKPGSLAACQVLNNASLSDFIGQYICNNQTKSLQLKSGYIKQYRDKTLPIYLTETLNTSAWLSLFELARKYNVKLELTLAPEVSLPEELSLKSISSPVIMEERPHTRLFTAKEYWALSLPEDAIVIDISELEPTDLLTSLDHHFDENKLLFEFTERPNYLKQALSDKKTVVLKGTWPNYLAKALEPLLHERLSSTQSPGKLILVTDSDDTFPCMPKCQETLTPVPERPSIKQEADYEERFAVVNQVLKDNPFVFLSGASGIGKTRFIKKVWKKNHPACHHGYDGIKKWIEDLSPGLKTLFIDEANITSKQWSEFEGLFNNPPGIFYQGQYYKLTPEHRVIFAGNPLSYGGERQMPSFFTHHHCEVTFKPIPQEEIAKKLGLNKEASLPILAVYDFISNLDPNDTLITPREVIMMARLTQAAIKRSPDLPPEAIAKYFAYTLSQNYIPALNKSVFDNLFKPELTPNLPDLDLPHLVINQTNKPAYDALVHQLNLREQRLAVDSSISAKGGLGGVIIEGNPGIGKSMMVKEILTAKGLLEKEDYYYIPASWDSEKKRKRLTKAFHTGKIVIIDEINSSPMLEDLLNALLEGHDLQGQKSKQKGFMLIGTQNPSTFKGRVKTTLPLLHRLQTVKLKDYSEKEKMGILSHIGLPRHVRQNMVAEFALHKKDDPKLCFRDLLKTAKKWVKHNSQYAHKVNIELQPHPQVGQICKVTSIANVESYYANLLGYTPIPMKANKSKELSIRKIAKLNGSLQGEILEFGLWTKLVTEMGFDTKTVDFKQDIHLFSQTITESLHKGDLPMLPFSVDLQTGHPKFDASEEHEHAAVITGYNLDTDEVTLSHWGKQYTVDLVTLFNATQMLATKRKPEFYNLNEAWTPNEKDLPKYLLGKEQGERTTIIPTEENSGFRSKLLIVKKPDKQVLLERREKNLSAYRDSSGAGFFEKKPKHDLLEEDSEKKQRP